MTRAFLVVALLSVAASGDEALDELTKSWGKLDAAARAKELEAQEPCSALLNRCKAWLGDADAGVRVALVRTALRCAADRRLRVQAAAVVDAYVADRLAKRARREREEFAAVLKEHGRTIPPDTEMAAGADWKDPYDPQRRSIPADVLEERSHMVAVLAAMKEATVKELHVPALRVFREHHDPEVLRAAIECLGAWRAWESVPEIADLARIQGHGRGIGGADVIGREPYETMRLKWDVHKDRLWWSRPEYVPRLTRPLLQAATAITGTPQESARELDAWLLGHEAELKAHGVTLTPEFRTRAQSSQG